MESAFIYSYLSNHCKPCSDIVVADRSLAKEWKIIHQEHRHIDQDVEPLVVRPFLEEGPERVFDVSRAEHVPLLGSDLALLLDPSWSPLEHLKPCKKFAGLPNYFSNVIIEPDDKNDQSEELSGQADPKHHQVSALVPEVRPYLGAQGAAETLDKMDGCKSEGSLLGAGDLGDEGGDAHAEGDVAARHGHGEINREQQILLGPGHKVRVQEHAACNNQQV